MFFFDCWREVNNKLTLFRMHQDMGLTKPCSLKFNWKWNKQEWCFGKIWTHFLSKEGGSFPRCEFSWAWKDQNSSPQSDRGIRLVVALASQLEDKNRIWNSAKKTVTQSSIAGKFLCFTSQYQNNFKLIVRMHTQSKNSPSANTFSLSYQIEARLH